MVSKSFSPRLRVSNLVSWLTRATLVTLWRRRFRVTRFLKCCKPSILLTTEAAGAVFLSSRDRSRVVTFSASRADILPSPLRSIAGYFSKINLLRLASLNTIALFSSRSETNIKHLERPLALPIFAVSSTTDEPAFNAVTKPLLTCATLLSLLFH